MMKHTLNDCGKLCLTFFIMASVVQAVICNRAIANTGAKGYHIIIGEDEINVEGEYFNVSVFKLIGLI